MPKFRGSRYPDLTELQGVTPVYREINEKPFSQGGRVGNFKSKLLPTVYSHASFQDYALSCDSVLRFI